MTQRLRCSPIPLCCGAKSPLTYGEFFALWLSPERWRTASSIKSRKEFTAETGARGTNADFLGTIVGYMRVVRKMWKRCVLLLCRMRKLGEGKMEQWPVSFILDSGDEIQAGSSMSCGYQWIQEMKSRTDSCMSCGDLFVGHRTPLQYSNSACGA